MSMSSCDSVGLAAAKLIGASLAFAVAAMALNVSLPAWSCWMFGAMALVAMRHAGRALRGDATEEWNAE